MKRSLLILMIVMVCSNACSAESNAGLVLHYSFDQVDAATVQDSSGMGNDGKVVGAAKQVTGAFGSAIELDGNNSYVDSGINSSLDISNAGSVSFWFKPKTTCQGGLVGWTADKTEPGQRLVVALNTFRKNASRGMETFRELGMYMADGKDFHKVHGVNLHKPYFPLADRWLFYTVTFNGRSVDIYRDGVHTYGRFQAMAPDLKDVALWIGRCQGVGGESDYFKGLIDEVRVYDRAISVQQVYALYIDSSQGRGHDTSAFGSIGIKPAAYPRPGTIFADLDYRGLVPTGDNITIKAQLLDNNKSIVATGKIRMLPIWGRAEAVFAVQTLSPGNYTVRATANKGKPGLAKINWTGRAKGWKNIKVLNNFCWELLNKTPKTKASSEYTLNNPREGWIYFFTEAVGNITLTVDTAKPKVVHHVDKPARQENMRWMPKGNLTVKVNGNGELKNLIVRCIPMLLMDHYPHVGPGTANDHEFLLKYVLPHMNILSTNNYEEDYNTGGFRQKWANIGRRSTQNKYPRPLLQPKLKDETARQQIYDFMADAPGMNKPEFNGISLDEFDPGNEKSAWVKSYYNHWIDTCTEILNDPKFKGYWIIPWYSYNMHDYEQSSAFLRTFVKHNSYVANEMYLLEQDGEDRAWLHINEMMGDLVDDWEKAAPGVIEHMLVAPSQLEREYWNPQADFNVYMDMQFEHLATRPEFFGLAGIMAYTSYHSLEEYVRWIGELSRHYGINGQTERMGKDPYVLTHIDNPDFINATTGWQIEPAEKDSITVMQHDGYGVLQERYPYRSYTHTPFLRTRRSKDKANQFSQTIKNLVPGRTYWLSINTGDYQELLNGSSKKQVHAMSATIENTELVTDWYRTSAYDGVTHKQMKWQSLGKFGGSNRYCLNFHRWVFRAKSTTARLVISDWKNADDLGGPIGQKLMFNNIEVRPYHPAVLPEIPLPDMD